MIETHTDKAKGTQKQNLELKQVYVLLSAFNEKELVTPIQFEIKQYVNDDNRLYLAVALTKFDSLNVESKKAETGVKDNAYLDKNQESTSLVPVSEISISDLFAKINPADKNFLKYIPNQFLTDKQIEAKNNALELERRKYSSENSNNNFSCHPSSTPLSNPREFPQKNI